VSAVVAEVALAHLGHADRARAAPAEPVGRATVLALVQVSLHVPPSRESLATAGALVGAPVYVPVVLQAAGVLEQLAALVAGVPPAPAARVQRLAHTV